MPPVQTPAALGGRPAPAGIRVPPPSPPAAGGTASQAPLGAFPSPAPSEPAPAATPPQPEPAPPAVQPTTPAPHQVPIPVPQQAAPAAGTVMWSGPLQRDRTIVIDGATASAGTLRGALPGVPVIIEVDSKDVGVAEAPSPSNGWKRVVLRSRVNRNTVVNIRWRTVGQ